MLPVFNMSCAEDYSQFSEETFVLVIVRYEPSAAGGYSVAMKILSVMMKSSCPFPQKKIMFLDIRSTADSRNS